MHGDAARRARAAARRARSVGDVARRDARADRRRHSVERAVAQFVPRLEAPRRRARPRTAGSAIADPVFDARPRGAVAASRASSRDRLGAVVVALALEQGAVVRFRLYERGRMVDEYLSVPTFYGELPKGDELALEANPTLVARLTGADRDEVRRVDAHGVVARRAAAGRRAVRGGRADDGARAVKLIDAARVPVLRARADRARREGARRTRRSRSTCATGPPWVYDLNATGRVPILDDGFVLPESAVIMEYLEERYPEPALLPADPDARARGAARRLPLRRRCSATTTTPSGAASRTSSRRGSRRSRSG